jgi:hypothetical protein
MEEAPPAGTAAAVANPTFEPASTVDQPSPVAVV